MTICHLCGAVALEAVDGFEELPRVTSDCRPWPAGGRLAVCRHCGTVQKPVTPQWHEETQRIYAEYALYPQAGGAEQRVFDQRSRAGDARSHVVLRRLFEVMAPPAEGALLDFGCGNGAMLRAAAEVLPNWRLDGLEPYGGHRQALEEMAGIRRVYERLDELVERYQLITLIHSLEHLVAPAEFLRTLRGRLTDGGGLVVEVPFYAANPFELLVADHCSHFDPAALRRLAVAAGFEVLQLTDRWVPKELSLLARPALTGEGELLPADSDTGGGRVVALVRWLGRVRDWAEAAPRSCLGVFGTAIAAGWFASLLGEAIDFFVDEDPARIGRTHLARRVVAPAEVPAGATVLVALPPLIAAQVAARLARGDVDYRIPPPLPLAASNQGDMP